MSDASQFTAESAAQHQAELNDYLQSKNINQLFIQIVESLLIEKPDNPIGFIVEFLQKKYPDQAGVVAAAMARGVGEAAASAAGGAAPPAGGDDEEEEESDDEEDYVDELPKVVPNAQRTHRESVFAEPMDEKTSVDIALVEKSAEERERILEVLTDQTLFKHLDDDQRQFIVGAMFVKEFSKEDVIIQQGDDGDNFYIIDKGVVDCYRKTEDGEGSENKLVLTYQEKGAFGELAIMYNAPRAATCVARTDCRLYALERKAFKHILMKTTIEKRQNYRGFLQNVPILKELNEYEVLTMADALVDETYEEGKVICRQGEAGDRFYIIKSGSVVCTQADALGKQVEVARLGVGDYFGEIALLTSQMRQATVVACEGPLKLLMLDRKTFKRVMGPLEDILRRNMDSYKKIRAQHI